MIRWVWVWSNTTERPMKVKDLLTSLGPWGTAEHAGARMAGGFQGAGWSTQARDRRGFHGCF